MEGAVTEGAPAAAVEAAAAAAAGARIGAEELRRGRQTAAALALVQWLPPQDLEASLEGFAAIAPHVEQAIEPYVSRPLKLKRDPALNKYFVACDYTCDGGTPRSPWTNRYEPPPEGGEAVEEGLFRATDRVRRIEELFNEVFEAYTTSYYDGGVSSVYAWDLDEGFACACLIRKELAPSPE